MIKLNLTTNHSQEEKVKAYLEENASEVLAEKINNGVSIVKDGKTLFNKKTMETFGKYAYEEARKQAEKGATCTYIDDPIVYAWAIHYFEENSLEGLLFNEDGTEYKPVVAKPKVEVKPVVTTPPKQKEMTLFDLMESQAEFKEVKEHKPEETNERSDVYDLSDF